MAVHRFFYPNVRPGMTESHRPLLRADPVVTSEGVRLEFLQKTRAFSPNELRSCAKWLFSLAHEAETLAKDGLVNVSTSYDVEKGKLISA